MREEKFPGTFIVVEGADGAGTTTQAKKLAEELEAYYTAEPAGNKIGRKVEEMISDGGYSAEAIALAFAADRMAHLEEEVLPRLREGEIVVSDRYYHSSLVYQPTLGADYSWVLELNENAVVPDLTVLLDVPTEVALSRIDERERGISRDDIKSSGDGSSQAHLTFFEENRDDGNIFENMSFQEEVATRYRELSDNLGEEIVVVDSSKSIEDVFSDLKSKVSEKLGL